MKKRGRYAGFDFHGTAIPQRSASIDNRLIQKVLSSAIEAFDLPVRGRDRTVARTDYVQENTDRLRAILDERRLANTRTGRMAITPPNYPIIFETFYDALDRLQGESYLVPEWIVDHAAHDKDAALQAVQDMAFGSPTNPGILPQTRYNQPMFRQYFRTIEKHVRRDLDSVVREHDTKSLAMGGIPATDIPTRLEASFRRLTGKVLTKNFADKLKRFYRDHVGQYAVGDALQVLALMHYSNVSQGARRFNFAGYLINPDEVMKTLEHTAEEVYRRQIDALDRNFDITTPRTAVQDISRRTGLTLAAAKEIWKHYRALCDAGTDLKDSLNEPTGARVLLRQAVPVMHSYMDHHARSHLQNPAVQRELQHEFEKAIGEAAQDQLKPYVINHNTARRLLADPIREHDMRICVQHAAAMPYGNIAECMWKLAQELPDIADDYGAIDHILDGPIF